MESKNHNLLALVCVSSESRLSAFKALNKRLCVIDSGLVLVSKNVPMNNEIIRV